MNYFYSPFLTTTAKNSLSLVPDNQTGLQKYLYISTLSRILTSLEKADQTTFLSALNKSEQEGIAWLQEHPTTMQLIREHLERMALTFKTYDTN